LRKSENKDKGQRIKDKVEVKSKKEKVLRFYEREKERNEL